MNEGIDHDPIYPDALLANAPLGRLTDAQRTQLVSRMRTSMLDAMGVGGSPQEVMRRARDATGRADICRSAIYGIGQDQFVEFSRWMYARLQGLREGVT